MFVSFREISPKKKAEWSWVQGVRALSDERFRQFAGGLISVFGVDRRVVA